MNKEKDIVDPVSIQAIEHLLIRDKDTGEILVNKRDVKRNTKQETGLNK